MPANLTPQYKEAENQYRQATTPDAKLQALQLMLRELPKHKGTEKIKAELKRKISEQKKSGSKKSPKKTISYNVNNNGYPQVVVIGAPNSGRSKLISELTGADLKVADYPYTTRLPQPAIMEYENVKIQLVDTPPISADHTEPWISQIVRNADAVIFLVDLSNDDVLDHVDTVINFLENQKIYLINPENQVRTVTKKATLMVANKKDHESAETIGELVVECYANTFEIFSVSSTTGEGMKALKQKIFALLGLIRIISKLPGKKIDWQSDPILLKKGSTLWELADHIHHDLAKKMKSAKVWHSTQYPDAQRIPIDYVLEDGNGIEIEVDSSKK